MDRRFHNSLFSPSFIELVPNAHLPNRCKTGVLVICCLFSFLTLKAEGQTNWNEGQVRFDFFRSPSFGVFLSEHWHHVFGLFSKVKREVDLHCHLVHENIVRCYACFQDAQYVSSIVFDRLRKLFPKRERFHVVVWVFRWINHLIKWPGVRCTTKLECFKTISD